MIIWAFNLLLLAVGILIVGLIKPKWLFFWVDEPNRFLIVGLSVMLLMGSAILFGEGNRLNEPLSEVVQQSDNMPVNSESPADLVK